ncbi:GPCR fungal pheromone mating factor, partial [Lentinula raphanica]
LSSFCFISSSLADLLFLYSTARNTGTCLFMAWIGLACIILSINSFLWKDTISNLAPVWCDISSKLLVGSNAAIASVASCINIRLWLVASDRVRTLEVCAVCSRVQDSDFCIIRTGMKVHPSVTEYFVQNRRFDIYEGFGCRAASDNVLLMYLLLLAPQFLLGIASTTFFGAHYMLETQYSPAFHQRTTLSASFLGFLILGGLSIVCSVAYTTFVVYFSATADGSLGSFTLWQSWDLTHRNISAVNVYTEEEWRGDTMTEVLLEANRWIFVGLAYLFFLVFGLTSEVRRRYRRLIG